MALANGCYKLQRSNGAKSVEAAGSIEFSMALPIQSGVRSSA